MPAQALRGAAKIKKRVGTEIAHLSYQRVSPSAEWDEERLWNAISEVGRRFLDRADPERIDGTLAAHLRRVLDVDVTNRALAVLLAFAGMPSWALDQEVKAVPVPGPATATTAPSYAVQHGLLYELRPDAD